MKMCLTTSIEVEIEVEVDYSPGISGRYSGPPEDCYPDEPSCAEIIGAKIMIPLDSEGFKRGYKTIKCPQELIDLIDADEIQEKSDEQYGEFCDDMDARYEEYCERKSEERCEN